MDKVTKYLSDIGRKGGKSGKGESKKRSPEHYKKLVEIRRINRFKKRMEEKNGK